MSSFEHQLTSPVQLCTVNSVKIAYQTYGDSNLPAVILIAGLGAQMSFWPRQFCQMIAKQGFRVIVFDNRDIGLSQKFEHKQAPSIRQVAAAGLLGTPLIPPYSLEDMLDDTLGLMNALGVDCAHVVGVSMGGMIGQLMAINHPQRMKSLTAMMTTSGKRTLPKGNLPLLWKLFSPKPKNERHERTLKRLEGLCNQLSGPVREDPKVLQQRLIEDIKRGHQSSGVGRQGAAVAAARPRTRQLKKLTVDTLVIHGTHDPLLPYRHGIDLTRTIPGASLQLIEGMGHTFPSSLSGHLSRLILRHIHSCNYTQNQSLTA